MEKQIEEYISKLLGAENSVLNNLYRQTNLKALNPGMISGHEQGRLLATISCMCKPNQILEIGTFTGYSAICLAEGLTADGHLHTIEIDDELSNIALTFFDKAGISDKITLHIGDALEIIPKINTVFDMVFIDAAKKQYLDYYHAVFDKVRQGGYILADNILWYGKVANQQFHDETTIELRKFNDFVSSDDRVEKAIVRNRDGLFILKKIK